MENSSKQKVVYIVPLYDKNTDTHFRYNYELIDAASKELDIFVIVEKAQDHSEARLPDGQVRLPKNWRVQKFQNPVLRFLELWSLCSRLHASGCKNVYVHYSYYGALAGILSGMKVFYWNRGMPWLFERSFFEERIFRFILKRVVLATSPESLAKEYQARYGVKDYRILSNWIDTERFAPAGSKEEAKKKIGADPATRIILFVHHLSERKGADLIAKTAAYFAGQSVEFWVAGDGPYRSVLEEEAGSSPVPIKILGKIPNDKIPNYFRAADVFFMPSREEGSPHVLLESMAAGTPFVAANVGGVEEIVPRELKDYLCSVEDVNCFSVKIQKLLSDGEEYTRVCFIALHHAKLFGKERGTREFIELFEE